jgi:hypothetical protein
MLFLSLVVHAVADINKYLERRKLQRQVTNEVHNQLLALAKQADRWLHGQYESRVSFLDCCLWHDMEPDFFREEIYRQWTPREIELMRDGAFIQVVAHGRRVHEAPVFKQDAGPRTAISQQQPNGE